MDVLLRGLSAFLMIALPLALGVYFTRRWHLGWGLALVGAVTFLLSQVGHIPFNGQVLNPLLVRLGFGTGSGTPAVGPLAVAAVLLGLSAGVFEEGARFLAYRFWIRRARTYRDGVLFGLGHGGAEAIAIGVLAILQHAQAYALRGQDLSTVVPPDQLAAAEASLAQYWATPAPIFLLGAVERASALAVQITLAVLVLQTFTRRGGALWLLGAILWHAAVDAAAVFAGVLWGANQGSVSGAIATEILVAAFAVTSLVILLRLRPATVESPAAPPLAPPIELPKDAPVRPERLDDTRYSR
ncbi:MAG TPA: YhfC family glutamic-type intramembrane protease [Anaerolineales bacterium]|nr:YhfC family glutamic-type intramembrane protease [Anaerolineales bacterium]